MSFALTHETGGENLVALIRRIPGWNGMLLSSLLAAKKE
jgi:hypothetical protein